jgi:uncharacterized membrane protein YccF (DUF307 family)
MKIIGNLIWLLFGGLVIAIEYFAASMVLMVTIIGIPFGIQTLKLGILALWPFGFTTRHASYNSGCLTTVFNILWIFCGGIWISLTHLIFGIILGITIIGIPFAMQHFKLATLALTPFGREIIESD